MEIEFTGLQEILQRIGNLPLEEADENRAVNKAANIVKKAVQEEVTANGWSFENEIKTKRAKDGEAKVHSGKAYHAHILEGGRSAGSKYALKNGKRQKVTWGPIAPNPFFTRGFEKSKAEAMKTMEDEVKKVLGL